MGDLSTPQQRSETADGVTRESGGRTRLPLLRPLRQDQPRGHSGARLCPVPLQQGRAGRGSSRTSQAVETYGAGAMAGRTGACAQAGDLPTGPLSDVCTYRRPTANSGRWASQPCARSGLHDSSDAGVGADLRSRPSTGTLRLLPRAETPNRRWSRRRRAAVSRSIRKLWTPTSRTTSGAFPHADLDEVGSAPDR